MRGHTHALRGGGGGGGGGKVCTKNLRRSEEGKGAKRSVAASWIDVKGYAAPIRLEGGEKRVGQWSAGTWLNAARSGAHFELRATSHHTHVANLSNHSERIPRGKVDEIKPWIKAKGNA